jgi:hypothetical protein
MALCIVQRLPFLVGGLFAAWELASYRRGVFPVEIDAQERCSPFDITCLDHLLCDFSWYAQAGAALQLVIDPTEKIVSI